VTKELFGKEMDPIPIAVKFDCAIELAKEKKDRWKQEKCMQIWYFYYFYAMNT
jgi:hypothetical protein